MVSGLCTLVKSHEACVVLAIYSIKMYVGIKIQYKCLYINLVHNLQKNMNLDTLTDTAYFN